MGWQDAPLVNQPASNSGGKQPAWMNAPLANAPAAASSDIAQPGPDTLGNMGWNDPRAANSTTKDFLLAHLSELGKGLGQLGSTAADYARTAANTYGQGDSTLASLKALYGDITGPSNPNGIANVVAKQVTGQTNANDYLSNLARAKADTAAASDRLGTAGTIAANMTGGGPLGEVASGVKGIVAPYVGRFAGPLAGAITGGGSTAAGEIGRNEELSPWDIGIGTVTGGIGGAPAQKGGALAPPIAAADLKAAAQQIYQPLDKIIFNTKSEVVPELDAFKTAIGNTTDLTNRRLQQATGTNAILGDLGDSAQLTGRNIQEAQRSLDKIANSPSASPQDQEYAPKLKAALQNVMDNGLPFSGVPAGAQASGYAGLVQKAGDKIFGRFKDVDRLNTMVDKSAVNQGPDIGNQASSYLTSKQGQTYAPSGSTPYKAFNNLADTAAKESAIPWWVKHFVIAPAAGTAINEGFQAFTGEHESPLEHVGADLGMGLVLAGSMSGYGAYSAMRARAAQQRALAAARSSLSTGKYQAPIAPDQPFRDAVRRLIFSQGAAGRLPGQ
jgi:hypothetical protein